MEDISEDNFNKKVINYSKSKKIPFVLFFYSDNCGYCHVVENILDLLSSNFNKRMSFFKINTNRNRTVVDKYYIKATPTILIFDKDSFLKNRYVGNQITFEDLKTELSLIEVKSNNFFENIMKIIKG